MDWNKGEIMRYGNDFILIEII